ncbi:hypothetical protein CYY_000646 [Polysphondylium violaceum]|uniref:Uncharacterized protein n=1 Tax=Polysphondylium violaceum TaxID=133409 RepID=A0A8J4Q121_9MYCE|nr:hypothetical protein CYY_000646 [Polysphondylium violaceum]
MNTKITSLLLNNAVKPRIVAVATPSRAYSTNSTGFLLSQKRDKEGKLYTIPPKKWEDSLATASESIVKAERSPNLPIDKLQKLSVEKIEKNHTLNLNAF